MSNLVPELMTTEELAAILFEMGAKVLAGDSFEGSIEYLLPEPPEHKGDPEPDPNLVHVRGAYRVGNLQGQGGMRMIGTVPS